MRRRWWIWVPAAIAFLAAFFHRIAIGVVADKLMSEFAIERAADLGLLAAIYFYTYAALQIPAGILADVYGPRRVISSALFVSSIGALIFGWADSMAGLYIGRFITSFGVALIYVNIIKIQSEWFRPREFATMTGLVVLVGNAGSLLASAPLALVVEAFGWRASFFIIATYSLGMAALCWLLIRNSPADVGLPAVMEFEGRTVPRILPAMRIVMGNRFTWIPALVSGAIFGVHMSFIGAWGIPYLMQVHGMTRMTASNHIMAMVVGNMVGGPLVGRISDYLGLRRRPFAVMVALFLCAWLLLTFWNGGKPPEWVLLPICFTMGVGVSSVVLTVACVKEVNPPNMTGIAAGIANSGPFLGAAIMQPSFGWVLDQNWQGAMVNGVKMYPAAAYQTAFFLCVAVVATGLLLTQFMKETYCGVGEFQRKK